MAHKGQSKACLPLHLPAPNCGQLHQQLDPALLPHTAREVLVLLQQEHQAAHLVQQMKTGAVVSAGTQEPNTACPYPRVYMLLTWTALSSMSHTVEPVNTGHLCNKDTVCSPNHIELCTDLPLN